MEAIREVLVRIRAEVVGDIKPPDMTEFLEGQRRLREATDASNKSIEGQGSIIDETTLALKGEGEALHNNIGLSMDEEVARAVEATNRERAINMILDEKDAIQQSSHAHSSFLHVIHGLARPMTMMIHSAMGMARSIAMLTAANEQDAEAMARKLITYEAWIIGATSALHMIHAMTSAYTALAKTAAFAAIAQAGALAPLAAGAGVVAAFGFAIYRVADAFDVFGTHAKEFADKLDTIHERATKAIVSLLNLRKEMAEKGFGAQDEKDHLRQVMDRGSPMEVLENERRRHQLNMGDAQASARKQQADLARDHAHNLKEELKLQKEVAEAEAHANEVRERFRKSGEGKADINENDQVKKADAERDEKRAHLDALHADHLKQENALRENIAGQQERAKQEAIKVVDVLKQEADILKDQLKTQQEKVKAAEAEVVAARDRTKAAAVQFGHLSVADQSRMKRLAKKVEDGGKLTEQELKDVEKTMGETGFTKEQRRLKGEKGGFREAEALIHGPGEQNFATQEKSAESKATEERKALGEAQRKLEAKEKEMRDAAQTAFQQVERWFKTAAEVMKKLEEITRKNTELLEQQQQHHRA